MQADKIPVPILEIFLESLLVEATDENDIVIDVSQIRDILIRLADNKLLDISPIACDSIIKHIEQENEQRLKQVRLGVNLDDIEDLYKLCKSYYSTDDAIDSDVYIGE